MKIELARLYNPPPADGSYRVLVDRLWPRGVKKTDLQFDVWARELAPSHELRRWFQHDPARWNDFRKRYRLELDEHAAQVAEILTAAGNAPLLLLYGARDEAHNHAIVFKEWVEQHANELTESGRALGRRSSR